MASEGALYLVLEYISILLFIFLVGHCNYRSINYTLQIFCVTAIFNNINESFLIFRYGDRVIPDAMGTPGCIFSGVMEQFIPLAVSSLATCMSFNIWFLIVLRTKRTEKELLKWYCLFAFGFSFIMTTIAVILLRGEPFLSSYPRMYYCDLRGTQVTRWTFAVPMLITALTGMLLSVHTVIYLIRHFLMMRRTVNGTTSSGSMAVELSYCIRLLIFCISFGILVLMAVLDRVVDSTTNAPIYNSAQELSAFSDFSGALVGIVIFVIFGTTKEAYRTFMKLICCGRQRDNGNGSGHNWSWLPKWVPERFRPQARSESVNPMASTNSSGGTSGSRSATGSGLDRGGYPRALGAFENSAREKKRPGRSEMTETNSVMTFDDDYLAAYRDTSPPKPKPKSNFVSNYATNYTPTNNHTAENGNRGDYDLESAYSTPLASAASAPSSTTSSRESLPPSQPSRPSMSVGEQYYAYTPRVDRVGSHSPPPMMQRTSSNFAELSLPPRPQSLPPAQAMNTRASATFAELSLPPQTYIPRG
ncbi:hypothetical protein BGZ96_011739 [Linnemannia gamsii]|uniref:G-protein coupled receptors family 1 profile domain-containing protein n=1 Tax=Linnemannia gamsii TaxID=64522 RepID=A0ABQ7JS24_9FUNG|nr:hypothetical protein BGZ96_011739 [Linnemannia gamsii]